MQYNSNLKLLYNDQTKINMTRQQLRVCNNDEIRKWMIQKKMKKVKNDKYSNFFNLNELNHFKFK